MGLDGYDFDSSLNVLSIKEGALKYVKNRLYEFIVSAYHSEQEYSQIIRVNIQNVYSVPVLSLR